MPSEEKDPSILSINVSEDIKSTEVPPGTPKPSVKDKQEALPREEVEKRQKIMLEYTRLMGRYVEPHTKKTKWIKSSDIEKIMSDGRDLAACCNLPRGKYSGISALAHSQIDDKDPLRFFVLANGMVIINPVIIRHTNVPVAKNECCMSFYDRDIREGVLRYNKITVMYQTLAKGENGNVILSDPLTEELSGGQGHMFQHKISHLNGAVDIYNDKCSPDDCLWLGNGIMSIEEVNKLYDQESVKN